jgi:large subunit ribosomal protein L21
MAATAKKAKTTKAEAPKDGAFSVIQTGGKQYLVSEGQKIKIEAMKGELTKEGRKAYQVGDKLTFGEVVLSDNGKDATTLGAPFISGAKVEGEIVRIDRAKKVVVIKYKAKSNYFKKRGHRQPFFEVKITKIA